MAFDEELAGRIRVAIGSMAEITEKKMFGGLSFLYKGKMAVGVVKDDLCVRVIEEKHPDAVSNEFSRPMNFTGKNMKDFLFVDQAALKTEEELMNWINLGIEHAESKS